MNTIFSQTGRGLFAHSKIVILIFVLSGCATSEPKYRVQVSDFYELVPLDESQAVQVKDGVRITSSGEAKNLVQPFKVQKCVGALLAEAEQSYIDNAGQQRVGRVPVMETVNPLQGYHVRKFSLTNNTAHRLPLSGADFVIVDGSGNDIEHLSKAGLEIEIGAIWPCPSGTAIVRSLKSVKLIGQNVKIRQGRTWEGYIVFPRLDLSIGGDWLIEYNDIPVATEPNGDVSKRVSFDVDLTVKHSRTTTKYVKTGFLSPWVVESRATVVVN